MGNPLLQDWTTPYGIAPFDKISDDDFASAFGQALSSDMQETLAVANNSDPPTFTNTIEALIQTGKELDKVLSVFYSVAGSDSNATREALMQEFSPKLSEHSSGIFANKKLFARIQELWKRRDNLGLNSEQSRVLMLMHRNFVRSGAALEVEAKDRIKKIKSRLAVLGTKFSLNLLEDERRWYMELSEDDMECFPDFLIEATKVAAKEKKIDGAVITLSRSLIVPFLQFSPRRELREKAYKAWASRGASGGDTDNRGIAREMLGLRQEMACLLGYANFAAFKLETEMAKTSENVFKLLSDVWHPAKVRAEKDASVLAKMMCEDGIDDDLEKWDWLYYSEKRRKAELELDETIVKPFFQLEQMINAAFDCSTRLFGLEFKEIHVPLYHPDCRAWEVTRQEKHVALFIGDYFARGSKRSGAWCSAMRSQAKFPREKSPIVINVCNFAKGDPTLLSYDEARTLFHEFGHALHQMLSEVTYEMISGTSVPRDFVELPSQLYEHWLEVPKVLEKFATHIDTGEAMPPALIDKVLESANFDMGFQTVEYLASAMVDMDYHTRDVPIDIIARQDEILKAMGMPNAIGMRHATTQFGHIFSSDSYASGYYSYMWSEVMDTDAFAAFQEKGDAFDFELARSLEENILSKGGSEEPEALYKAYRGRLPVVEALLRGRGLLV